MTAADFGQTEVGPASGEVRGATCRTEEGAGSSWWPGSLASAPGGLPARDRLDLGTGGGGRDVGGQRRCGCRPELVGKVAGRGDMDGARTGRRPHGRRG